MKGSKSSRGKAGYFPINLKRKNQKATCRRILWNSPKIFLAKKKTSIYSKICHQKQSQTPIKTYALINLSQKLACFFRKRLIIRKKTKESIVNRLFQSKRKMSMTIDPGSKVNQILMFSETRKTNKIVGLALSVIRKTKSQLWKWSFGGSQASYELMHYLLISKSINIQLQINLYVNFEMMKIFGKNTNQLFRRSQKLTYSMPQPINFQQNIYKCACGFDYLVLLTTGGSLFFLFQSQFYPIKNTPQISDVATFDNTICLLTTDKEVLVWEFDEEKIMNQTINYTKVRLHLDEEDYVKKIEMGSNDIFLVSNAGKVYHFKRNQWYETKSYSNIESLELQYKIVDVSSGPNSNLFLSYEGLLFASQKQDPLFLNYVDTNHKFIKIACGDSYNVGITKKGVLMIWGSSIHGSYKEPTQFTKLTKKFIQVKIYKENGFAVADDGQVWAWGVNSKGELGISDYESRLKPFPVITLQKCIVRDIFCGPSYTCCIFERSDEENKKDLKVVERKKIEFKSQRQQMGNHVRVKSQISTKQKEAFIKEQEYEIKQQSQSPVFNKKTRKAFYKPNARKIVVKKDISGDQSLCSISKSPKPSRSCSRSPSPCPSGSPLQSKYCTVNLRKRQKSQKQRISQKYEKQINGEKNEKKRLQKQLDKSRQNKVERNKKIKIRQVGECSTQIYKKSKKEKQEKSLNQESEIQNEEQRSLKHKDKKKPVCQRQMSDVMHQNELLKVKVSEQEDIITDITGKIRLLEEAIDEHERNLTARDSILSQYQKKQKDYLNHIEQLQKKIDEIVRYKQKNNEVMVIYENMKNDFEKQRNYYTDKIKQYQIKLYCQENRHKEQLEQGRRKNSVKQAVVSKQNKENSRPFWDNHSPILQKSTSNVQSYKPQLFVEQKQSNLMHHFIDQIESNKSRITKSANKLIALLDISQ